MRRRKLKAIYRLIRRRIRRLLRIAMEHPREAGRLLWNAFWDSWTAVIVVSCAFLVPFALATGVIGPVAARVCFITANAILLRKLSTCRELHGPAENRKPLGTRAMIVLFLLISFSGLSYWEWAFVGKQFPPNVPSGPLAEWQQTLVLTTLSAFKGSKVLILAGVGDKTAAYANQFRDLFKKAGWIVRGPEPAPRDQVVLDVSIGLDLRIGSHPEVPTILSGFTSAGIKHRPGGMRSPNIPDDWLVLWVGSESPEGEPLFKPLQVPKGTF
jgi:hypothetical protein